MAAERQGELWELALPPACSGECALDTASTREVLPAPPSTTACAQLVALAEALSLAARPADVTAMCSAAADGRPAPALHLLAAAASKHAQARALLNAAL